MAILIPRHLESNGDVNVTCRTYQSPSTLLSTASYLQELSRKTTDGQDIQGFYALQRQGVLLPMTKFRQVVQTGSASGTNTISNGSVTYYISPSDGWVPDSDNWVPTPEVLAQYAPLSYTDFAGDAAAKIYSSGFDALTFVAELSSVKGLFTQTARRLLSLATKPSRSVSKLALANDWLSARYGWRTLVYDIESLSSALAQLSGERKRHSEKAGTRYTTYQSDEWSQTLSRGVRTHQFMDEILVELRGSVVADVEVPAFQFNPLQTAWEVIPLSFVIDWLVGIGRMLATWSFLSLRPNYVAAGGYRLTVKRDYSNDITQWLNGWSGSNAMQASSTSVVEVRTPCQVPMTPHFQVRLNVAKIIDLVSLLIQRR